MSTSSPRFLAEEGCDFAVVRALREAGFDVVAVCEIMTRSNDSDVITLSHSENRILITEDKDFGWLVFVSHADSAGVILIRYPGKARSTLPRAVVGLADRHAGGCKIFRRS
jgi:predicted nuclease of predicted toxin-antitoxin system